MEAKALASLVIFAVSYLFIGLERVPRIYISVFGASLLVFFQVYRPDEIALYVDWETIGFLFGIFISVRMVEESGFLNYLSLKIARAVRFDPNRILIVFPLLAWALSGFVDSITVMAFMAPLTYALCRLMRTDPVPLVVGEACLANIGGAGTLMGDPPNVILGSMFNLGFLDFVRHNWLIGLLSGMTAIGVLYLQNRTRKHARKGADGEQDLSELAPEEAIEDRFLMRVGGISMGATVALLVLRDVLKNYLPLNMAVCGLLPAFAILSTRGNYPKLRKILQGIDLETLIFFCGLFTIVGALEKTGLIQRLAMSATRFSHNGVLTGGLFFWGGAFTSSVIDNVPEAMSLGYVIRHLGKTIPYSYTFLIWCSSLGLDIGGSITPIGASGNVVAYSTLERQEVRIGWGRWLRIAVLPTFAALAVSWLCLFLKYRLNFY